MGVASSPPMSRPRRQTADAEIPVASDARPRHTSRGFLPWKFAYAGPGVDRATIMRPHPRTFTNSTVRRGSIWPRWKLTST